MKKVGIAIFLLASLCCAQESGGFQAASTNVWGAEYPRVDSAGRVQIRVKAPEATKVRLNFWSEISRSRLQDSRPGWSRCSPFL